MSQIESEIDKYQNRIDRVYEDYFDDKITENLYARKSNEYRIKQKKLQRQRDNIELVDDEYFGIVFHLLSLDRNILQLYEKGAIEQKGSLLQMSLSNFLLEKINCSGNTKKPFERMAVCRQTYSWLPIQVKELLQGWWDTKRDK